MPNHITNRIAFEGDKKQIKELVKRFTGKEDEVIFFPDFNKVIPRPEGVPESCGWNTENWGSKWNSYHHHKVDDREFFFDTAWDGVPEIVVVISKAFPEVTIYYEYADEDTGYNVAQMKFAGGVHIMVNIPEGGSKEAYELAFALKPGERDFYELVDGSYVYIDDLEE